MKNNMSFRTDINGLRALAVIAVVLFHFDPTLLPGGFVGVDVFFVISGFLMTKIIVSGIQAQTFSLKSFYTARGNRIIPPLATLCLVLLLFGWFFLPPNDYRQVGNDVLNSMLFISNFIYAKEKGYFETSISEQWLLHTWSLSAEWQFYLLYPLILLVLFKYFTFNKAKKFIIACTITSFITCIVWTSISPTSSYFLLPSRAWEMLIGGVAFLYPLKTSKKHIILPWVGIVMIVASTIFIQGTEPWPSHLTLLPILGSYLVIASHQSNIILDTAPLQKIGTWSYSIYLWHWVILTVGVYLKIPNFIIFGVILSITFGYLSYQFIEKKSRGKLIFNPVFLVLALGSAGGVIHATDGAEFHYSDEIKDILSAGRSDSPLMCNNCKFINGERVENDGLADLIILGDSHAGSQLTTIPTIVSEDKAVLSSVSSGCLFIPHLDAKHRNIDNCKNQVSYAYNKLIPENKGATLLFIQRTNIFFTGYTNSESQDKEQDIRHVISKHSDTTTPQEMYINTICHLANDYNVLVTRPTPEQVVNVPNFLIKSIILGEEINPAISIANYESRNKGTEMLFDKVEQCGVTVLDPIPYLCDKEKCPITKEGKPLYRDDDHLNEWGSQQLTPMYKQFIK
jgi:peptidoglycan/LPS O-acetylase OafA/YrhL